MQIVQRCTLPAPSPPANASAWRHLQKLLKAAASSLEREAAAGRGSAEAHAPARWLAGEALLALHPTLGGSSAVDGRPDPELGPFFVEDPELEARTL